MPEENAGSALIACCGVNRAELLPCRCVLPRLRLFLPQPPRLRRPRSQRAVRSCACATSWVRSTTTGCSPPSTRIAARFLPAARGVSHQREKGVPLTRTEEVPLTRTEEQVGKKTGYARARFAK